MEFASEQFTGSESSGFIEVVVRITGGTSITPITVTVTPTEQSPVSAMGKLVYIQSQLYLSLITIIIQDQVWTFIPIHSMSQLMLGILRDEVTYQ